MAQRKQVPVLLLTGFLGSGKTSLLSRWLRAPEFAGAMVIVNELGEVGLDDRLVQTSSDTPLLLDNGCACCTANEDLVATLERLFWDRLHRTIPPFEWVLIETTGVADPAPILASLQAHDIVAERYRIAGVVTTIDARRGVAQLARHPENVSQLRHASVVVLTKTDVATAQEIAAARTAILDQRPDVRVLESARADLPASTIVAALSSEAPGRERLGAQAHHDHARHDHDRDHAGHGHDGHTHAHAAHAGDVTTHFLPLDGCRDIARLERALDALHRAFGDSILRLKGAAPTGAGGATEIIQSTPGDALERTPYATRAGAEPMRHGLTIIAQETPAAAVADYLAALLARDSSGATGAGAEGLRL